MKKILKNTVIGLMAVAVCLGSGVTGYTIGKNEGKEERAAGQQNGSSFVVQVPDEKDGIEFALAEIASEDFEVYGVSATAESAKTLTATIKNEDAGNKNLIWTIEWNGSTTTWGGSTEKDIEDYVTMDVAERDGVTQTATLSCYGGFGTQILVTVAPEDDPSLKRQCTLDYAQKITSASLNIGDIEVNLGGDTEIEFELGEEITGDGGLIECDYATTDIYTIAEEFTCTSYFGLYNNGTDLISTDFKLNDTTIKIDNLQMTERLGTSLYFDYKSLVKDWYYLDSSNVAVKFSDMSFEERESYFSVLTQPYFRIVHLTITGAHSQKMFSSKLKVSGYRNSTPVSEVSLDSTEFVF